MYLCIEYQIYLSEVTEFLDFSLILSSILAIVFQNEVLEIKKISLKVYPSMVNDVQHILGINFVIIFSFLQLIGKLSIKSNPHSLTRSKTTDHHFVEALYMKFLFRFSFYLTCLFVFKDFHFYYNSAISNCKNHSNAVCS